MGVCGSSAVSLSQKMVMMAMAVVVGNGGGGATTTPTTHQRTNERTNERKCARATPEQARTNNDVRHHRAQSDWSTSYTVISELCHLP